MKRKFIIDTDCGLDDAMAIMMALACGDIEILAITCVNGNTNVDNVVCNVFRTQEACGKMEVPVFKGASEPIMGKFSVHRACDYHGNDGFGDVCKQISPEFKTSSRHAVSVMTQFVSEHPGNITIVTLGPLTNLALAIRMDPTFSQNVKEIFMMGGNCEGQGNITVSAEANFCYDPEAAHIVLNEMKCPIIIATWELCLRHPMTWDWRKELLNLKTKQAELIKKIEHSVEEKSINLYPGYILCDQLAMAAALTESSIATKSGPYYVTVEPHGHYTRGQMIIDKTGMLRGGRNAIIIDKLNMSVVKKLIFDAMSG